MREYTTTAIQGLEVEQKVTAIICNQCGREIRMDGVDSTSYEYHLAQAEVLQVKHQWGYGSKYDTECHAFDLCDECYEKLIRGFRIPISVEV